MVWDSGRKTDGLRPPEISSRSFCCFSGHHLIDVDLVVDLRPANSYNRGVVIDEVVVHPVAVILPPGADSLP